MAHFALCPRTDMPPAGPSTVEPSIRPHLTMQTNQHAPFNWQQQEHFQVEKQPKRDKRNRKSSKAAPLDLEATAKRTESPAANHIPINKQPQIQPPSAQLKASGKTGIRESPHLTTQSAQVNTAPSQQGHVNTRKKSRTNRKQRKPRSGHRAAEMATQRPGSSVPPHLRKRATAATQSKPDVRLGDCIAINNSPASGKSQAKKSVPSAPSPVEGVAQNCTPLTPATTVEDSPKRTGRYEGGEEPASDQSFAASKRKESKVWSKAPRLPKERHVWLKSREIPRNISCGSQSDGGVTFKSDSQGDPSYDVKKLMDWNGDWLPPPEEWAARKGFTHRHFGQLVEQWANGHSRHCTDLINIDLPAFSGIMKDDGEWLNKDLVPRYWLHDLIDNATPRKFWEEFPQRAPSPFSDVNIMKDPPYWERWQDDQPDNCFMTTLVVPDARIDANDHENELESPFAMLCVSDRLARINDIKASRKRREEAKRNRPVTVPVNEVAQMPDRRLHPKANIYLRPVQPADVRGIMMIYNHYVKNTVYAAELDEQTEAQISCWIDAIVQAGLPCLVAVAKRNQRRNPQGYMSETIVGFIHLEEYVALPSMYRYTFELALYVHPGYIRQSIGKCLLDQMMYIVHTGYNRKGGFEWVNDFEYLKNGKSRTIKTIIVGFHYERGDDVDWVTSYLGDFGFRKAGRFAQVGHKVGKVVDKVLFQLQTTEVIDPNNIPTIQD